MKLIARVPFVQDRRDEFPCPQPGTILMGLFTATAAEGAFPMAPDFQPWITRIDPNYGQPACAP